MHRNAPERAIEQDVELVLPSLLRPLDFQAVFGRQAPLEIDLGCGDGTFLASMAAEHPERNFVGLERLVGRVRTACRRAVRLRLPNVRVLRLEASYAVAHLLSPDSVHAFHLLFPDPWPKRRHWPRRIFTRELVQWIHRALVIDGVWHIATDDTAYFERMQHQLSADAMFQVLPGPIEFPPTTFERRFAGRMIYRLLLRKTSPVR